MKNCTVLSTLDLVRHLDSTTQVPRQVLKLYGPWFPYMQSDDNKTYPPASQGCFSYPAMTLSYVATILPAKHL